MGTTFSPYLPRPCQDFHIKIIKIPLKNSPPRKLVFDKKKHTFYSLKFAHNYELSQLVAIF